MEQFYITYEKWEDYNNGMYCLTVGRDEYQIIRAKSILSNPEKFKEILFRLIDQWPISTKVNLTNKSINRNAWLGAAACSFEYGVTEINTRHAWAELNDIQRYKANEVADLIVKHYERENNGIHKNMGGQMLF